MKTLIVYFSLSGRTRRVAERIKAHITNTEADIGEYRYTESFRVYLSDLEAIRKGILTHFEYNRKFEDLSPYDVVMLGTPVHGAQYAPVFRHFFSNARNMNGKRFILFSTCRFIPGNALPDMQSEIEKKGGIVLKSRTFKGFFFIKTADVDAFIEEVNGEPDERYKRNKNGPA
ncbi:MAG: hypothetical protein JW881_10635 [Spirochaetales bacterium]|nr:hypothetical protein [Spirochaetales bacterium]